MPGSEKVSESAKAAFREKTRGDVGIITSPFCLGNVDKDEKYLLVHTNIVVPIIWNFWFWWDSKSVLNQLKESFPNECLGFSLSLRFFRGNWETITIWKNSKDLKNFYIKGTHARVMMSWRKYIKYGENAITTRYTISGKELDIEGYGATKAFFNKIKHGQLGLWNEK